MGVETEHFLSALVKALPALISIFCPTFNSFKRLMPDASVGSCVGWGIESKEAPFRVLPRQKNVELKTLDHTANHYYALGTLINVGRIGILEKFPLPERLPSEGNNPLLLKIPTRWSEIEYFMEQEAGALLKRGFGEELCEINLKVRHYDIEHYYKFTLLEEIKDLTTKY